jgi:hypothetical protein
MRRNGETTPRLPPPASGNLAHGRGRSALIGDDWIPPAVSSLLGPGLGGTWFMLFAEELTKQLGRCLQWKNARAPSQ